MLRHLAIRNLALIDRLEIDLEPGFTVLTGETGAGKSILIDALGLVLGHRADTGLVRSGAEQAEVSAEFVLDAADPARSWLQEQALEDDDAPDTCLLRRRVAASGRTRAFVNDRTVSLGTLRSLGDRLVDIFGQGESQMLVRPEVQRELLDANGHYAAQLQAAATTAGECRRIADAIAALRSAGSRDPEQLDYLRFQIDELETLAIGADETVQLEAEQRRLAHADQLLSEGNTVHANLYDSDDSVYDRLSLNSGIVERLSAFNPALSDTVTIIDNARELIREAADNLRTLLDTSELDPARLAEVETRMTTLHDIARKHHIKPAELPARLDTLQTELGTLENAANALDALNADADQALSHYRDAASALSQARRATAVKLAKAASQRIQRLGMANAEFAVVVESHDDAAPSPHGVDTVRFDFTANPGQPPRPLAKVASGGELSRIGLALQVIGESHAGLGTMIFDEVDSGVGGSVAETVGAELAALGKSGQVLCVTHLAQVAGQGQHHLFIRKQVRNGKTYTDVTVLDRDGRIAELARMSGGHSLTAATQAHARELLGDSGD